MRCAHAGNYIAQNIKRQIPSWSRKFKDLRMSTAGLRVKFSGETGMKRTLRRLLRLGSLRLYSGGGEMGWVKIELLLDICILIYQSIYEKKYR